MLWKRELSAYIFFKLPGAVELEMVDLLASILVSIAVEVVVDRASGMTVVVGVDIVVVDECDDEDEELVDGVADIWLEDDEPWLSVTLKSSSSSSLPTTAYLLLAAVAIVLLLPARVHNRRVEFSSSS